MRPFIGGSLISAILLCRDSLRGMQQRLGGPSDPAPLEEWMLRMGDKLLSLLMMMIWSACLHIIIAFAQLEGLAAMLAACAQPGMGRIRYGSSHVMERDRKLETQKPMRKEALIL